MKNSSRRMDKSAVETASPYAISAPSISSFSEAGERPGVSSPACRISKRQQSILQNPYMNLRNAALGSMTLYELS